MRVVYPASATHLGINRSTSQSVDFEGKMSLGRRVRVLSSHQKNLCLSHAWPKCECRI